MREDEPVLVDHVTEADRDISEGDNDVASNDRLLSIVENAEEQREVLLAEPRANTHEFGKREDCCCP